MSDTRANAASRGTRDTRLVAVATIAVFALADPCRPYLLDALGIVRSRPRTLLDLLVGNYSWYLLPPLVLGAALFGVRRSVAALGLHGNVLVGLGVGLCATLPMLAGYAACGHVSASYGVHEAVRYALLPGVMEEILFRGMLFGFLFRFARWGFVPAALLGAVVFGAGHLWQGHGFADTAGVFAITAFGAAWFAWLYVEWDANLWVPIAFHVLMNLYWDLFAMGESALGGGIANLFRFATVFASIALTLLAARRRGGRIVRGRRWWRDEEAPRAAAQTSGTA